MQQYYQNGYTAVAYPYQNQFYNQVPQQYSHQMMPQENAYLSHNYQNIISSNNMMQTNAFPQQMMIPQMQSFPNQINANYINQGKQNKMQMNYPSNNGQGLMTSNQQIRRSKAFNGLSQQKQMVQKNKKQNNFVDLQNTKTNKALRKNSDDTNYNSDTSTQAGDIELECSSTNNSKTCTPSKNRDSDEYYQEATCKKPKKQFINEQERENFVRSYQIKYKTEMCRNWELFGKCKFQDKCSFAHGDHELHKKVHLPQNYKTKPCTQFHTTSYCPYGNRCQFLHSQFDIYSGKPISYENILNENVRLSDERATSLKEGNELLSYVTVFPTRRLRVFESIIPNQ